MSAAFGLDPRLQADTHVVTEGALCRVLRMDEARWPWLILVPRRHGLRELIELDADERAAWWAELDLGCAWVRAQPGVHKLNVAALGNVVAQLHVHVVGRWPGDPAWPAPVWGVAGRQPLDAIQVATDLQSIRDVWATSART